MNDSVSISMVLLQDKWKQNGTNYYRLRLTLHRKSKYIKTSIIVHRDDVNAEGMPKSMVLRRNLDDFQRYVEDIVAKLEPFRINSMDVDDLAEYISHANGGAFALDFFAFGREAVAHKPRNTANCYISALNSLSDYVGKESMDISNITSSFMRGWESWLVQKYGPRARCVSAYTAGIRHIHNLARQKFNNEELDFIPIKNPFLYYKAPVQRQAAHRAIDLEIVRLMAQQRKSLSGLQRLGVDVFLLSFCLIGMNCPDLYYCAAPKDGIITYNRTKTKNVRPDEALMKVRIEPQALDLVREYAGKGDKAFRFDKMYTTYLILGKSVNRGLAAWCSDNNIHKVTLYAARHTWASTAYKAGVDKGVINDCLCHVDRDMRVTDVYIDKDWSVMWKANQKTLEYFMQHDGSDDSQARI